MREATAEDLGAVVGVKRRRAAHSREVRQLLEVIEPVRDCDEPAAAHEHTRELGHAAIEVRHVVEHPVRDRDVERLVVERQVLDRADARLDAAGTRELDHPRRDVDRHELGTGPRHHRRRELAPAAAHLEHAPR
jgi:hypothetical protein